MKDPQLKYQKRIVVFLDVLGFKNSLYEFEKDAIDNHDENKHNNVLISEKANQFVGVFKDVISLIDEYDCKYYLFSDNICITVDPYNNTSLAVDILFTVSDLFKRFSEMGYFIRGGIDFGWMLDEDDIVLGVPLVEAYIIESKKAIYPRIVLSEKYLKFLKSINLTESDRFNLENFLIKSCEINYINTFYNIIRTDNKVTFLETYKKEIAEKLLETKNNEKIYAKFNWLKNEFNSFIERYVNNIDFLEQDFVFTTKDIEKIKKTKIY